MVIDTTEYCQGLTGCDVDFVSRKGPVFYASLPCGRSSAEPLKHLLVSTLWGHLAALESPLWQHCQPSNKAALPLQVGRGLLGRPYLLVGEHPGPAISFSEGGGKTWAALCGDESAVGIDVAAPYEFQRGYPLGRVFQPLELEHALRLAGGDLGSASALLWSVKEAVVKALGCAFHLVDPRQITVYPPGQAVAGRTLEGDGGHTFPVGLSGKALARFPVFAGQSLCVRSFPQGRLWLSIALLKHRPAGHEQAI